MSAKHFVKNLKDYLVDYDFTETDEKKIEAMFDRYRQTVVVKEVEKIPVVVNKPVFRDRVETVYVDVRTRKRLGNSERSRLVYASKNQIDKIFEDACNLWGIEMTDLFSEDRHIPIPWARFFCYHKLYDLGMTCTDMARLFKRDHSTVLSGIKKAKNLIETGNEPFSSIWNKSTFPPESCDKCGKLL